jgi:hypothetical protein
LLTTEKTLKKEFARKYVKAGDNFGASPVTATAQKTVSGFFRATDEAAIFRVNVTNAL